MSEFKSIGEILSYAEQKEEVYTSDQKKRKYRASKGQFTRYKGTFDFVQLIKSWDQIVGDLMAKNTVPLKIKYQTLYINTKHSVFAQELSFLVPQITEKIEHRFPNLKGKIKKIKFSFSNTNAQQLNQKPKLAPQITQRPKKEIHKFSPEYLQKKSKASRYFSEIEDEEVRESLIKFFLEN